MTNFSFSLSTWWFVHMTQLDALGMYVWKNNGKDKMKRRNN